MASSIRRFVPGSVLGILSLAEAIPTAAAAAIMALSFPSAKSLARLTGYRPVPPSTGRRKGAAGKVVPWSNGRCFRTTVWKEFRPPKELLSRPRSPPGPVSTIAVSRLCHMTSSAPFSENTIGFERAGGLAGERVLSPQNQAMWTLTRPRDFRVVAIPAATSARSAPSGVSRKPPRWSADRGGCSSC